MSLVLAPQRARSTDIERLIEDIVPWGKLEFFESPDSILALAEKYRSFRVEQVLILSFTGPLILAEVEKKLGCPVLSYDNVLLETALDFPSENILVIVNDEAQARVLEENKGFYEQSREQVRITIAKDAREAGELVVKTYATGESKVFLLGSLLLSLGKDEVLDLVYEEIGVRKDLRIIDCLEKLIETSQKSAGGAPSSYTIKSILPCIAESDKIRVIAVFDKPFHEAIPILFLMTPASTYNEALCALSFRTSRGELVSVYGSGRICIATVSGIERAKEILEALRKAVEKAYNIMRERGGVSKSVLEAKMKIRPLDVYKLLPKTNCGDCGESSCMAFAVKLVNGQASPDECPHLSSEDKRRLEKMLFPLGEKLII